VIDFENMVQRNPKTGMERKLRCVPKATDHVEVVDRLQEFSRTASPEDDLEATEHSSRSVDPQENHDDLEADEMSETCDDASSTTSKDAGVARPKKNYATTIGRGSVQHTTVSYRGKAAAAYTECLAEHHQSAIEKAPHRLRKTTEGQMKSVPVTFSHVGAAGANRQAAEELDKQRQLQEAMQLKQDEHNVASWIFAVTSHHAVGEAVKGNVCLLSALQSGEALCDLINAIWPGRIEQKGILRGEVKAFRRVENIAKFCQVCTELGMAEQNMFAPAKLSAGQESLRSCLFCLFALGALLPESPEYEGPRLHSTRKIQTED